MKYIFLIIASAIMVACNFDYSQVDLANTLDSDIPDIQLLKTTLTYVRGTIVVIESEKLDIYSDYDKYDVESVQFREMDKTGEIRMIGSAEKASINSESNDVTLTGNIKIRSNKDDAEMFTNFVQWRDEERVIEGGETDLIVLKRDDGSTIQGYGFVGDADSRELTLKEQVTGKLVVEEQEKDKVEVIQEEEGENFFDAYE